MRLDRWISLCSSLGMLVLTLAATTACSHVGDPDKAPSQLEFGVDMARRGLWSEAHFRFEQARRLDASNPRVLNNLAVASEALGRFEEAQKYYQEALRLAPQDPEVKGNYVRFTEFYLAYTARPADEEPVAPDLAPGQDLAPGNGSSAPPDEDGEPVAEGGRGGSAPGDAPVPQGRLLHGGLLDGRLLPGTP